MKKAYLGSIATLASVIAASTPMGFSPTEIPAIEDKTVQKKWKYARPRKPEDIPLAGRNEPCPCDSGKKYKKCCLK